MSKCKNNGAAAVVVTDMCKSDREPKFCTGPCCVSCHSIPGQRDGWNTLLDRDQVLHYLFWRNVSINKGKSSNTLFAHRYCVCLACCRLDKHVPFAVSTGLSGLKGVLPSADVAREKLLFVQEA